MDALYDLAVVGAGLTALGALRAGVATGPTVVIEYQDAPGGFLAPALPAEGFEREWELVRGFTPPAGVTILCGATAVGLLPAASLREPHTLLVRRKHGTEQVKARTVLIACGGLEATRESAQVPGTRPAGVMTPALVHGLLNRGYLPGRRAVVYGASRYATATARRLLEAGAEVTLVPPAANEALGETAGDRLEAGGTTETSTDQSWFASPGPGSAGAPPAPAIPGRAGRPSSQDSTLNSDTSRALDNRHGYVLPAGPTVEAPAELVEIGGSPRLERVTLRHHGSEVEILADTFVYAAGMAANTHWLKGSGVETGAHGAVLVDSAYRTNVPRVYAAGTVVAPSLDHVGSIVMGKEVAGVLAGVTP